MSCTKGSYLIQNSILITQKSIIRGNISPAKPTTKLQYQKFFEHKYVSIRPIFEELNRTAANMISFVLCLAFRYGFINVINRSYLYCPFTIVFKHFFFSPTCDPVVWIYTVFCIQESMWFESCIKYHIRFFKNEYNTKNNI